jgi:hypothetical protein
MIVCPNCNHQNPDGAVQCEACYTPLPALASCPSCGAAVQSDASFCGQCGFNLKTAKTAAAPSAQGLPNPIPDYELTAPDIETNASDFEIPDLIPPDPLILEEEIPGSSESPSVPIVSTSSNLPTPSPPAASIPVPLEEEFVETSPPTQTAAGSTQLQVTHARLFHIQTNTSIELPSQLNIVHIGKPNDRIPPTIDVSGFPNSEIVSRVHADIRIEGDIFYIEDVGSSNGTYVNNMPLPRGNRHRLRAGDRIALGKGDKVTFIFQSS